MSMRIQRSSFPFLMGLYLLSGSLLVSCGSQGTSGSQSSEAGPPPILLRDPSPGQLEAYISVAIGGYEHTTRETTTIRLSFASNGRVVQFAGNEQLMCNGTSVPLQNQVASFQVLEAPTSTLEGHPFTCTYSVGGLSATLMLTVPHAPAILSPQDLAQVSRATNTIITYEARGGKLLGIVALGQGRRPLLTSTCLARCKPLSIPANSQSEQVLSHSPRRSTHK
jgi:hypothetical protein